MKQVLLADDSEIMLDRLQQMLLPLAHVEVVGTCKNGLEALNSLRFLKPDLAILDVKMPGLSGFEVLKEIRKENHTIKIIILTFYSAEYQRTRAMKLGADYFFSKVDDFEKIPDVILQLTSNENE
ncbi:MAG: response regulator transcription factor [Bacteroidetes bacterium]|nr:response regulator transcription factor [Bacteroidota bacterium]